MRMSPKCHCEPVTDVTGVAIPETGGKYLFVEGKCLKIQGIPTPVCALARNDMVFRQSEQPCDRLLFPLYRH